MISRPAIARASGYALDSSTRHLFTAVMMLVFAVAGCSDEESKRQTTDDSGSISWDAQGADAARDAVLDGTRDATAAEDGAADSADLSASDALKDSWPQPSGTRLVFEDFDDQSVDDPLTVSQSQDYGFESPGYGGSGYAWVKGAPQYDSDASLTMPVGTVSRVYSRQLVKFSSFTGRAGEGNYNIKMFYPHFCGTGYAAWQIYGIEPNAGELVPTSSGGGYYAAKDKDGNVIATGVYMGMPIFDGQWHVLEYFVDVDQARVKGWIDGSLMVDQDYDDASWSGCQVTTWTLPGFDAEEDDQFKMWVDNWELWTCTADDDSCEVHGS